MYDQSHQQGLELHVYSDADWEGSDEDRKSTRGYFVHSLWHPNQLVESEAIYNRSIDNRS